MKSLGLGEAERRFAELIWANAPLPSTALVKLAEDALGWKKSTTYTVLKRLCDKGLFQNEGGTVRVLLTKEAFNSAQSEQFVEETFSGSLPAFLAAFTAKKKLTRREVEALQKLIDDYEEETP
ncbi:MAG: BlaI/MecI/CopY family transcriptional regulator [Clostridia bacterium]|nr:BlaI/MecI/CopY family transcriptional regulator [Clostridia bacterium]